MTLTTDDVCYSFFFNDTATTEIYTLSLHDALPISGEEWSYGSRVLLSPPLVRPSRNRGGPFFSKRSEEHTSELQSQSNLVCRLLLEKKKKAIATSGPPLHHRQLWCPSRASPPLLRN